VIGLAKDNARVFYNWKFIENEERIKKESFPRTLQFIESMCDLRLPQALNEAEAIDLAKRVNAVISEVSNE